MLAVVSAETAAPGEEPDMPKWMDGIDAIAPGKASLRGAAAASTEEPAAHRRRRRGLGQLGLETTDAVVSLLVFVIIASATIALPVLYYLVGGDRAHATLTDLKAWLTLHNDAVMTVLFLVFGVKLVADAIPPLTG
jgi:hypothetical protein